MTWRFRTPFALATVLVASVIGLAGCFDHDNEVNKPPVANIAEPAPSATQLTTISFSSAGTTDPDGTVSKLLWNFGDGQTSSDADPVHRFSASGPYTVSLTATDNNGATASATRQVFVAGNAASAQVSDGGIRLAVPSVGSVEAPPEAFAQATTLGIWTTANADTNAEFSLAADMFSSPLRASVEVRVNTGRTRPSLPLQAVLLVPEELLARLQVNDEVKAYVQIYQTGGEGVLDNFEQVPSTYDANAKTLTLILDPSYFTDRRIADDSFEAVIVVGTSRTRPATASGGNVRPPSAKAYGGIESPAPWPALAIPGEVILESLDRQRDLAATTPACDGATLRPPLTNLTVTSAFNGTTHFGTDYRAANGTEVYAMASGTIFKVGLDERPLKKPDPRSGKLVKGWGHYVVVRHDDGSKSLYAHLQAGDIQVAEGTAVTAGQLVALSDNSGGSGAPHLHVEYAPNGEIFQKSSKVDPNACIGSDVVGGIQVRDNGQATDDAFTVSIGGRAICSTTIGASNSCSLGALRSGTASLSIRADIAPDQVGTYEITLSSGITFQGGGTRISGTLGEGESATFTIVIP